MKTGSYPVVSGDNFVVEKGIVVEDKFEGPEYKVVEVGSYPGVSEHNSVVVEEDNFEEPPEQLQVVVYMLVEVEGVQQVGCRQRSDFRIRKTRKFSRSLLDSRVAVDPMHSLPSSRFEGVLQAEELLLKERLQEGWEKRHGL